MTTTAKGDLSVTQASQGSWYHGFTQAATTKYWAAIARIALGFVFLWAFLDKTFGLTYATPERQRMDVRNGRRQPDIRLPHLRGQPRGPFAGFFHSLGESAGVMGADGPTLYPGSWVNWVFMLALLGAGVTLILGVFMRIGSIGAAVLLLMMYLAAAPWATVRQRGWREPVQQPDRRRPPGLRDLRHHADALHRRTHLGSRQVVAVAGVRPEAPLARLSTDPHSNTEAASLI